MIRNQMKIMLALGIVSMALIQSGCSNNYINDEMATGTPGEEKISTGTLKSTDTPKTTFTPKATGILENQNSSKSDDDNSDTDSAIKRPVKPTQPVKPVKPES